MNTRTDEWNQKELRHLHLPIELQREEVACQSDLLPPQLRIRGARVRDPRLCDLRSTLEKAVGIDFRRLELRKRLTLRLEMFRRHLPTGSPALPHRRELDEGDLEIGGERLYRVDEGLAFGQQV